MGYSLSSIGSRVLSVCVLFLEGLDRNVSQPLL